MRPEVAVDLREAVKEGRQRRGITWSELASRAGVDKAHLMRWQQRQKGMDSDKVAALLGALGGYVCFLPPEMVGLAELAERESR